ncbi:hypothetical protein E2986_13469 [Frieseomelitta varia]|uniref:Sodium-coupled monocarboxylate transporter 2 n=1 Tax=Frieseomelitta varia TaxID=561572 RepID=A0A833S1Q6_9HYME|nr:hypothetical protein E2986_13469 [Frieseomelitta varia]
MTIKIRDEKRLMAYARRMVISVIAVISDQSDGSSYSVPLKACHLKARETCTEPRFPFSARAMASMGISIVIVKWVSVFTGLIMYARYHKCDPISTHVISRSDQLLPYYVLDVAANIPGLPGLFLAGLVSAGLSTMSAALNTVAGTIYEDFIDSWLPDSSDKENRAARIMKIIVVVIGVICMVMVFVVDRLGDIFRASLVLHGITAGAMLGIFTLGMLVPWATSKGVIVGGITSMLFMIWLIVGAQVNMVQKRLVYPPLPMSTENCLNHTIFATKEIHRGSNARDPHRAGGEPGEREAQFIKTDITGIREVQLFRYDSILPCNCVHEAWRNKNRAFNLTIRKAVKNNGYNLHFLVEAMPENHSSKPNDNIIWSMLRVVDECPNIKNYTHTHISLLGQGTCATPTRENVREVCERFGVLGCFLFEFEAERAVDSFPSARERRAVRYLYKLRYEYRRHEDYNTDPPAWLIISFIVVFKNSPRGYQGAGLHPLQSARIVPASFHCCTLILEPPISSFVGMRQGSRLSRKRCQQDPALGTPGRLVDAFLLFSLVSTRFLCHRRVEMDALMSDSRLASREFLGFFSSSSRKHGILKRVILKRADQFSPRLKSWKKIIMYQKNNKTTSYYSVYYTN